MTLPRMLFVCMRNAGRSQMAAALWESLGGEARSAGSRPAVEVHPEVIAAMRELGLDVAGRVPRALTVEDARWAEVVVMMGCGDVCPHVPGVRHMDWALADPHGRDAAEVRAVGDEIRRRLEALASGG